MMTKTRTLPPITHLVCDNSHYFWPTGHSIHWHLPDILGGTVLVGADRQGAK
jgi:hypothetical protein